MKSLVGAAVLAAMAGGAAAVQAPPVLTARQAVTLDAPGALAAFAVDASMVDVSVEAGQLNLVGRRAGETVVTVVLASGVDSFRVRIEPAPVVARAGALAARAAEGGFAEARFDSALHRLTGVVSTRAHVGDADVNVYAETLRQLDPRPGEARTALPAASIAITTPQRSIVLLDKFVQESALTLDGVVLRGVHVKQDDVELHAGIASWSPLEGFLASGGERAFTASQAWRTGALRITPHIAWFPDSRASVKATASVSVETGTDADPLRMRAEAGLGGGPAAAVDIDYRTPQRQAWMRGAARGADYAALATSRPPGVTVEGGWTEKLDERTTATAGGAASRLNLGASGHVQALSAQGEVRRQFGEHWSGALSTSLGSYEGSHSPSVRRSAVGAALGWDSADFGASALYRYQTTSLTGTGGSGARVSLRASHDGWRANGFLDVQQQAPTIDLVLHDRGDLARTLAGLGITAAQPEDILRALRDNAGLIAGQPLAIGPVRLNPLRSQAGLDIAWRGSGASRPEIGLRLLREHVDGVVGARGSTMASLRASWRVGESTDVAVSLSRWSTRREGEEKIGESGVQVSLRSYFDKPLIPAAFTPSISGRVMRDDTARGASRVPLAGVEVVLDRSRRTRTDSEGRYEFDRPGAGAHRIEAVLPASDEAYFTTPSAVNREAGATADFGIAMSGVRITGVVRNDAGQPVPGVTLKLEGASEATAVSDSNGTYRVTVAAGEVRIEIAPESVPPGHDLRALAPRTRTVASGEPATVNFVVRAMRSIDGVVEGVHAPVAVTVKETGRQVLTDAQGHFVLRQLPAGPVTLSVDGAPATVVQMPEGPGTVRGVKLRVP